MERVALGMSGCFELRPAVRGDARGRFVKVFTDDLHRACGATRPVAEVYYSVSQAGVVRGLHFQLPPHDHEKLVFCTRGRALDVLLDLRVDSPTYGEHRAVELSADRGNGVYAPRGMAHGFCALEDDTELLYLVTSAHAPEHDAGVRWDSAGIAWPAERPIVSDRDARLPALAEFASPFRLAPG